MINVRGINIGGNYSMSLLKFNVNAKSENPTKTVVEARGFKIIVDEPEVLGGTDDGPNPVEYVLASLAGCLNVVGHIIAKEMGFKLDGIEMELEGDLDPSKFTGKDTQERAGYKEIRVKVKPHTDADEQVLKDWLAAVENRCPVSDNIRNVTPVKISL
jgi:uncharacterized OsmC-like protein